MNKPYIMKESEFDNTFTMVKNRLDDNSSLDGCMFETYGKEQEYILDYIKDPESAKHVWTYADNDNGQVCFLSGRHSVNRIGYFVTKEPHGGDIVVELESS